MASLTLLIGKCSVRGLILCCAAKRSILLNELRDPPGEAEICACGISSDNIETGIGSKIIPTKCRRPLVDNIAMTLSHGKATFTVPTMTPNFPFHLYTLLATDSPPTPRPSSH